MRKLSVRPSHCKSATGHRRSAASLATSPPSVRAPGSIATLKDFTLARDTRWFRARAARFEHAQRVIQAGGNARPAAVEATYLPWVIDPQPAKVTERVHLSVELAERTAPRFRLPWQDVVLACEYTRIQMLLDSRIGLTGAVERQLQTLLDSNRGWPDDRA